MAESFFRNDNQETGEAGLTDRPGRGSDEEGRFDSGEFATQEGRMAAVMAYIPILCFFPLLNMRENKEARFHARQGVLLFLVELVAVLFLIDGVSAFVFRVVLVLAIGLAVAGVILSLQGRSYRLPILGDLAEKVKL